MFRTMTIRPQIATFETVVGGDPDPIGPLDAPYLSHSAQMVDGYPNPGPDTGFMFDSDNSTFAEMTAGMTAVAPAAIGSAAGGTYGISFSASNTTEFYRRSKIISYELHADYSATKSEVPPQAPEYNGYGATTMDIGDFLPIITDGNRHTPTFHEDNVSFNPLSDHRREILMDYPPFQDDFADPLVFRFPWSATILCAALATGPEAYPAPVPNASAAGTIIIYDQWAVIEYSLLYEFTIQTLGQDEYFWDFGETILFTMDWESPETPTINPDLGGSWSPGVPRAIDVSKYGPLLTAGLATSIRFDVTNGVDPDLYDILNVTNPTVTDAFFSTLDDPTPITESAGLQAVRCHATIGLATEDHSTPVFTLILGDGVLVGDKLTPHSPGNFTVRASVLDAPNIYLDFGILFHGTYVTMTAVNPDLYPGDHPIMNVDYDGLNPVFGTHGRGSHDLSDFSILPSPATTGFDVGFGIYWNVTFTLTVYDLNGSPVSGSASYRIIGLNSPYTGHTMVCVDMGAPDKPITTLGLKPIDAHVSSLDRAYIMQRRAGEPHGLG